MSVLEGAIDKFSPRYLFNVYPRHLSATLTFDMIFDTPWVPKLGDVNCVGYGPYEELVVESVVPRYSKEPAWSSMGLNSELAKTPMAGPALWESVLALWRLKEVEEEGGDQGEWQSLVSAWLVRVSLTFSGAGGTHPRVFSVAIGTCAGRST